MSLNSSELKTYRSISGFTLVEILISLLVLTMMLSLSSILLVTFLQRVGKARYSYAERAMGFYWLNTTMNSMSFYVIPKPEKSRNSTTNLGAFHFLFEGGPDFVKYATNSPLSFEGCALEHLYVKDNALYLNETPILSSANDYRSPHQTSETIQILLMERVNTIHLSYSYLETPFPSESANITFKLPPTRRKLEAVNLSGVVPERIKLVASLEDGRQVQWYFSIKAAFHAKAGQHAESLTIQ